VSHEPNKTNKETNTLSFFPQITTHYAKETKGRGSAAAFRHIGLLRGEGNQGETERERGEGHKGEIGEYVMRREGERTRLKKDVKAPRSRLERGLTHQREQ